MDRLRWIAVLSVGALLIAACGGNGGGSPDAEGSDAAATGGATDPASQAAGDCTLDEPVKVGVVFSQTGPAAVYGESQLAGVELATEERNAEGGVTYELVVEDDASDPAQGIPAFEKLINQDEVSVIIGPTLSNTAFSTDPVAQDAGVPVLGVSNTAEGITEIGDYIWRNSLTEQQVIPQTIEAAVGAFDLQNVATLYGDDDSFTVSGHETFVAALEEQGVDVAETQTFAKGNTDFAPQLTAARNAEPDALVVSALAEEAALIIQQAAELGIDVPIIGGNGFNSPAIIEQAGEAAEGVVVGAAWNSASDDPATADFIAAYQEAAGGAPDQFAAQAYAGMKLVAMAVESACGAEPDAIRDGFTTIDGVETVLGEFSFTDTRDADHPAVVQVVDDGEFAILE
ncbi:MAG: ABC transporter substrate-binding protein [Actinomycetota bacterium]|jgi:branched-chain amino acid transport system substrate-binding protein|nr:ABC transporter substrate-binding protein [Actinomycetota bacterium]